MHSTPSESEPSRDPYSASTLHASSESASVAGQAIHDSSLTLTSKEIRSKVDGNKVEESEPQKKDARFWLVFLSLCVSLFLAAIELVAVSVALPTIAKDLHANEDFIWVTSAYALSSTALIPASGGIAEIFGRRASILTALLVFMLGSALCGSARNMHWLIAGRTIQGAGGGGILSITAIILSDIVTLKERGIYNGILGLVWAVTCILGPIVGGSFAKSGNWRWVFSTPDMNLPIAGFALILVVTCLHLKTTTQSLRDKFARIDWIGNFIVTSSTTSIVLSLTWGGTTYPWSSAQVLTPLILGVVGLLSFGFYEFNFAREPIMPYQLVSNLTSLSGYIQNFIITLVLMTGIFWVPTFYQACYNASPIHSGVLFLPTCGVVGFCIVAGGVSVAATKRYRPQIWFSWAIVVVATGFISTLRADSTIHYAIGVPILLAMGIGILSSTTYFPVLTPLPVSTNAHALALFSFLRQFAGVWSITIGSAILDNRLASNLPKTFLDQLNG
ncbi:iron permease [Abortiporus biennis]|nr:iron permease [Abortiporus biennis]